MIEKGASSTHDTDMTARGSSVHIATVVFFPVEIDGWKTILGPAVC